jgi:two-component system nitrate/nitrite response regulator NarL
VTVLSRVRLVLADRHPVFLEGLTRAIKEGRPDLELVGTAADGREVLALMRARQPDVALLEPDLPLLTGTRILLAVVREQLAVRVLFLATPREPRLVYDAIALGAAGWVTKDAPPDEIADAVLIASRGGTHLSPALQPAFLDELVARGGDASLTGRERQVLTVIARGHTVGGAGRELGMSRATVKTHLQHLYAKLGVSSQAAAVAEAMRRGWME